MQKILVLLKTSSRDISLNNQRVAFYKTDLSILFKWPSVEKELIVTTMNVG
jgi:hypothetical protein